MRRVQGIEAVRIGCAIQPVAVAPDKVEVVGGPPARVADERRIAGVRETVVPGAVYRVIAGEQMLPPAEEVQVVIGAEHMIQSRGRIPVTDVVRRGLHVSSGIKNAAIVGGRDLVRIPEGIPAGAVVRGSGDRVRGVGDVIVIDPAVEISRRVDVVEVVADEHEAWGSARFLIGRISLRAAP